MSDPVKKCCECGFSINEQPVLIEFGWAHPVCISAGSDWTPKSW